MHALRTGEPGALFVLAVLAAAVLLSSGCLGPLQPNISASDPTAHDWRLVSYQENGAPTAVQHGTSITLGFEDSRASGSSGCNVYYAAYTLQGSSLRFQLNGQTGMHCEEPGAMDQESAYLDLLAAVEQYRIDGDRLALLSADGSTLLLMEEYAGPDPRPFSGTVWTLESYANGSAVVLPRAGTTITAVFSADGRVTGSGGCNQYAADYISNGSSLEVGTVSVTSKSCSAPVAAQEAAYLDLLASAEEYRVNGDWLSLRVDNRTVLSFQSASEDVGVK